MEAKVSAGLTAGVVAEYGKFMWPGRNWPETDSEPESRPSSAVSVLLHQNGANFDAPGMAFCTLEAI